MTTTMTDVRMALCVFIFLYFSNHPVHLPLGLLAYLLSFQLNQTIPGRSRGEDAGTGLTIKTGQVIRFHFRWFGWAPFPFSLSVFSCLLFPQSPVWLVYRIKTVRGREGSHLRTDVERESERQVETIESSAANRNLDRKCKEKRRHGMEGKVSARADGREGRRLQLKNHCEEMINKICSRSSPLTFSCYFDITSS